MTGLASVVRLPLAVTVFTVVADPDPDMPLALGVFAGGCRVEVEGCGDPVADRSAWRKLAAVAALLAAES